MATLTCHTEGCVNQDVPVEYEMTYRDEQNVVRQIAQAECTACHQDITDIKR